MIEPNELRVGGAVNYEQTTHIIKEIHSDKVLHVWKDAPSEGYYSSYDSISPIELQDEHFHQAGFGFTGPGKDLKGYFYHPKFMQLDFHQPLAPGLPWLVKCQGEYPITSLKALHHLQNFYFAITGEEMEVND